MEAKEAFTVLSDAKTRAEYDRRQQVVIGQCLKCCITLVRVADEIHSQTAHFVQGGFDWGGIGDFGRQTWQRTTTSAKPKQAQEEFYGFSDFFRDVEEEFSKRKTRGGREPGTLLEELAALGEGILEDFVEFLERELGIAPEEGRYNDTCLIGLHSHALPLQNVYKYILCMRAGSRSASAAAAAAEHAGKGSRKASADAAQVKQRAKSEAAQAERTAATLAQSAAQKAKNSEDAVDQMMAELKARLQREKGDGGS